MDAVRVLVVDDSATFRRAAKRFLSEFCGAEVVGCAESGEQAVEMTRDLQPQIVLMDLAMEGINGVEAGRRIKAYNNSIKVVILSLNGGKEYRELATVYALDGCVSKSEFTTVICAVIEDLR